MDSIGLSEYIAQALIMRMALEAISVVVAALSCLTLLAFCAYLIGVFLLCRVEHGPRRRSMRRLAVALQEASQPAPSPFIQHGIQAAFQQTRVDDSKPGRS